MLIQSEHRPTLQFRFNCLRVDAEFCTAEFKSKFRFPYYDFYIDVPLAKLDSINYEMGNAPFSSQGTLQNLKQWVGVYQIVREAKLYQLTDDGPLEIQTYDVFIDLSEKEDMIEHLRINDVFEGEDYVINDAIIFQTHHVYKFSFADNYNAAITQYDRKIDRVVTSGNTLDFNTMEAKYD